MTTLQNKRTCNVRIPAETHEQIKVKCESEGRIIGAFVDRILRDSLRRSSDETIPSNVTQPINIIQE